MTQTDLVQSVHCVFRELEHLRKFLHSILADGILNVKIVVGHINVGMAHNALNRLQINAQGLHLRNICMTAAVRSKHPYAINLIQRLLELIAEVRRVARRIRLANLPDKFVTACDFFLVFVEVL